jgi:hypothetical protein
VVTFLFVCSAVVPRERECLALAARRLTLASGGTVIFAQLGILSNIEAAIARK